MDTLISDNWEFFVKNKKYHYEYFHNFEHFVLYCDGHFYAQGTLEELKEIEKQIKIQDL